MCLFARQTAQIRALICAGLHGRQHKGRNPTCAVHQERQHKGRALAGAISQWKQRISRALSCAGSQGRQLRLDFQHVLDLKEGCAKVELYHMLVLKGGDTP